MTDRKGSAEEPLPDASESYGDNDQQEPNDTTRDSPHEVTAAAVSTADVTTPHASLLPRKRQANKSPKPPGSGESQSDVSMSSPDAIAAAAASLDVITKSKHQSEDNVNEDDLESCGSAAQSDDAKRNKGATRASLNDTFEAAAASGGGIEDSPLQTIGDFVDVTTPRGDRQDLVSPSAIASSALYTSPKRRRSNLLPPSSPLMGITQPMLPPTHMQQPPSTVVKPRKKGKQSSYDDQHNMQYQPQPTLGSETPPRMMQQPQQESIQQQSLQSKTPARSIQKQKRYRQSLGVVSSLFSPKPIYKVEGANDASAQRPPRPSVGNVGSAGGSIGSGRAGGATAAAAGDDNAVASIALESSPLTPSPHLTSQNASQLPTIYDNSHMGSTTTNNSGYESSPATNFRFHSFPASLPRVNPRGVNSNSAVNDGGGSDDTASPQLFSSTPFRLDDSLNNSNRSAHHLPSGPARLHLRPKPTPPSAIRQRQQHHLPPQSPATRCLFNPGNSDESNDDMKPSATEYLPLAPSFDAADEGAISDAVIAPSFSHDQNDISGDWSESTSMSFQNERMKMANVPSHVTSHHGALKFLEEEDEEVDTAMDEDTAQNALDESETKAGSEAKLPPESTKKDGTRLNFNSFFSPPQSSESSNPSLERSNQSIFGSTLHPHTPRSTEQFHNMSNLEMSPIVRLSEDDELGVVDCDIPMKGSMDEDEVRREEGRMRGAPMQPLFRDTSPTNNLFNLSNDNEADTSAASSAAFSAGNDTAASASTATANVNNTTMMSNLSSTNRSNTRKARPMPDTSAFDACTPSQQSLGSKDSGATSHKTAASDRLLCPPTPIRTPAWAHADAARPAFQRSNSLISTKVLAACPPRVLDNISSLEDSMLENDISGTTMDADLHPMLNSSFAPVEEKDENDRSFDEDDDYMFRPLSNGLDEQMSLLKSDSEPHNAKALNKKRLSTGDIDLGSIVSFSADFNNLGILGSGAFADVYKVRSKRDRGFYAIKQARRQFRGVKDRERAMTEVQTMQRLQNALESESHLKDNSGSSKSSYGLYLLFFIRAWQENGYFFCQTELCSRATCRHLRLSLTTEWERDVERYPSLLACLESPTPSTGDSANVQNRLLPERAIWQVCHDISRGLFHIHSHGMVHYDIKPSNIFFVSNPRWGTICKIGDFGLAGDIGTKDDGQEGDTAYMPNELLSTCVKHPGADIFSLGLTLYEIAASVDWTVPREGDRWHELRRGSHVPEIPTSRSDSLGKLIQLMLQPDAKQRPSAEDISEHIDVKRASALSDGFLSRYVSEIYEYDCQKEREIESAEREARRR